MLRIALFCTYLVVCECGFAQNAPKPAEQTLQFPREGSIGRVIVPVTGNTVDAVGEVTVPVDEPLSLQLIVTEYSDLSSLDSIPVDSIRSISISNSGQHEIPIEHIARFTALESLRLGSTPITDADAAQLTNLGELHYLEARSEMLTDEGAAHIANLSTLSYLDLEGARITDEGVAHLANLEQLRHLDLGRSQITNGGVSLLTNLQHLQTLGLQNTAVTPEVFDALREFNALNQLYLPITIGAEDVSALKDLPLYARLKNRGRGVLFTIRIVDARTNLGIPNAHVTYVASEGNPSFAGNSNAFALSTDAHGAVEVFGRMKQDIVRVYADVEGYVPRHDSFKLPEGLQKHPTKIFTLRLSPATSAGGFVVDSDGVPIGNAVVSIPVSGGYRPGNDSQSFYTASTNQEGLFQLDKVPSDLSELWVSVTHADYATTTYLPGEYDATAFRSGSAQFTIAPPIGLSGSVVDSRGRGIAGATVSERKDSFRRPMGKRAKTDANGEYFLDRIQPGEAQLTFAAEGYETRHTTLSITPNMPDHQTVLRPSTNITVTVVDDLGKAIPDASVSIFMRAGPDDKSNNQFGRNESGSEIVVKNVARGIVDCRVYAEGFHNHRSELDTTATDRFEIQLKRLPQYSAIRVIDADTEQPIDSFSLYACSWTQWHDFFHTRAHKEFATKRGFLSIEDVSEFANTLKGTPRSDQVIVVVADGYLPGSLSGDELFRRRRGKPTEVRLHAQTSIRGTLSNRSGSTRIAIANKKYPLLTSIDDTMDFRIVEVNPDGSFILPALEPPYTIFAWGDAGFAIELVEDSDSSADLALQPWTEIDVTAPAWFNAINKVRATTLSRFTVHAAMRTTVKLSSTQEAMRVIPGENLVSFSVNAGDTLLWNSYHVVNIATDADEAVSVVPKSAKVLNSSRLEFCQDMSSPVLLIGNELHAYLLPIQPDGTPNAAAILPGAYRYRIVDGVKHNPHIFPELPIDAPTVTWDSSQEEFTLPPPQ